MVAEESEESGDRFFEKQSPILYRPWIVDKIIVLKLPVLQASLPVVNPPLIVLSLTSFKIISTPGNML